MRRALACLVSVIGTFCFSPSFGLPGEIAADRNPIEVGQTATLRWYFTGNKVVVSGGRFGKGAVVTGRRLLSDAPRTTTRYTFDVWYNAPPPPAPPKEPPADGARPATAAAQAPARSRPEKSAELHAQYSIVLEVIDPKALGFVRYQDSRGWRVNYLKTWKRDNVSLPDPANNALIYFQQEDDSVERLALSILPVTEASPATLTDKILKDIPSHYENVSVHSRSDIVFEGVPAVLATFSGADNSHPGTRTQSIILVFIRGGLGYVVSARTAAARFPARRALLQNIVKSFMFTAPRAVSSAP